MNNDITTLDNFKELITESTELLKTFPQLVGDPVHRFAGGMYCRELTMPTGSAWISKVHKRQGFGIILRGEVSVASPTGTIRYKAPCVVITEPGTQRALLIHEETTWLAITALPSGMDENTDIEEIENYFACDSLDDYELFISGGGKCLIGE